MYGKVYRIEGDDTTLDQGSRLYVCFHIIITMIAMTSHLSVLYCALGWLGDVVFRSSDL